MNLLDHGLWLMAMMLRGGKQSIASALIRVSTTGVIVLEN